MGAIVYHGTSLSFPLLSGYSRRAKNILLDQLKVNAVVMELDLHPRGAAIQSYLGRLTSRRTVPNVFIGEEDVPPCV